LLFSPGNTGPLAYKRQIVTIHDASTFDQADAFTGLFARWYRWLLPRLARRALCVVTVSKFSRDRLSARLGISPERVAVIYNGVTPPPSQPSHISEDEIQRLRLPSRFLLFVGSQDPRKNVPRLLEAFSRARLGEVELLLAGGASPQLFNTGGSQVSVPRVRSLGRVSDAALEMLYARAEGFVFPSLYEGFGLPPLEAMARGCPVLTSDASCLPEVCGPDVAKGGACVYFSPHSVEAIAGALERFCNLPPAARQSMADAGRRHARLYSWDRCAADTLSLLQKYGGLHSQTPRLSPSRQALAEAKVA
jgi:glycosyltransferase involved in cell wall biosynthesis